VSTALRPVNVFSNNGEESDQCGDTSLGRCQTAPEKVARAECCGMAVEAMMIVVCEDGRCGPGAPEQRSEPAYPRALHQ